MPPTAAAEAALGTWQTSVLQTRAVTSTVLANSSKENLLLQSTAVANVEVTPTAKVAATSGVLPRSRQ